MFANAIRIFDVLGFQIRVDPSWLVIAALIVWSLSTGYFPEAVPGLDRSGYLLLGLLAMLGLFAGLILHELAHAAVARRLGLGVGGITLFLFGGVAELEREPKSAGSEFRIAIAGPVMSLAVAAVAWALAGAAEALGASAAVVALFGYLAAINLILAVFNMIPAFPLDGGRVLRAALWHARGDLLAATRLASAAGSIFGYALVALGLFLLFTGGGVIAGLWPILIGLFLAAAARGTYRQMLTRRALLGRTVGDLMTRDVQTTTPDRTVRALVDDVMLSHGLGFVPVVEDGRALGYVDTAAIRSIDRENWEAARVEDIFVALTPEMRTTPGEPIDQLLDRITRSGRRKFIVEDGRRFAGVVTMSDLVAHVNVLSDLSGAERGPRI